MHEIVKSDLHVCVVRDIELGGWSAIEDRETFGAQCDLWELDPEFEPYEIYEDDELRANLPEVPLGERPRDVAAKQAGFGGETSYRKAKQVVAQGTPELVDAMDDELRQNFAQVAWRESYAVDDDDEPRLTLDGVTQRGLALALAHVGIGGNLLACQLRDAGDPRFNISPCALRRRHRRAVRRIGAWRAEPPQAAATAMTDHD